MTDQLSETHSDARAIWECIYDHGNGKYRGALSSMQRDGAFTALGRLSAKAAEAIRLLQDFDKAMAATGDWPETVEETKRLKLLVDRVRFFLEPSAPPQSAEGDDTTTPQPAALPEPELGYIKTDKSRQPAFSARQMRAALQAQPAEVSDAEWWYEVLGSAGPDLLGLAKKWDANEVHVYQFVNEAEKIVKAAAQRAILALRPQAVPMTPASRDVIMATRTADGDADAWPEPWAYRRGWNDAEAHHGITAPAGGEGKA